jgi:hypothetical protein
MSGQSGQASGRPTSFATWNDMLRVPRILWAALMMSCVIYGGLIASGMLTQGREAPIVLDPTMALVFAVSALGVAVTSFLMPASILRQALAHAAPSVTIEERTDTGATTLFRDAAPRVRSIANPAEARAIFAGRFFTAFILSVALSEAVAVFGLAGHVAGFLPAPVALVFVGAAIVLQALRFPSAARCVAVTERAWNAKWPTE